MIADFRAGARVGSWGVMCLALLVGFAAHADPASNAACPGHPDAIGTSRTLVVDPRAHPRIGTMQYPETLPLRDHEIVLTFDDGPLPRNSNKILKILADNCAKATFFEIGQQARVFPEGVRKLADAGHTIGTHSQDHPLTFQKMPIDKAKQEIDDGIASVQAALPDPNMVAPFFRIPGLLRAQGVEDYLASRGIQVWSADFLADDWRRISPERVYELAIQRIEAKGKGILLLHDIHDRTVVALPRILHELKARGYHIVHVVPATAQRPATPTAPEDWQMHPPSETVPIARWPKVPSFVFAETEMLPAPALPDFETPDGRLLLTGEPFEHVKRPARNEPLAQQAAWPQSADLPVQKASVTLPIPEQSLFEMPADAHAAFASPSPSSRAISKAGEADGGKRSVDHRARIGHRRNGRAHAARNPADHALRRSIKHRAKDGAHPAVHVATLKKKP